jgi:hypothetical protein
MGRSALLSSCRGDHRRDTNTAPGFARRIGAGRHTTIRGEGGGRKQ